MPDPIRLRPKNEHGETVLEIPLSNKALEWIVALHSTGLWGTTVEEVCQRIVYRWIERSILHGELGEEDDG